MKKDGHAVGWCSETEAMMGMYLVWFGLHQQDDGGVGKSRKLTFWRSLYPRGNRNDQSKEQSNLCMSILQRQVCQESQQQQHP